MAVARGRNAKLTMPTTVPKSHINSNEPPNKKANKKPPIIMAAA
jgi:hypothetical protein